MSRLIKGAFALAGGVILLVIVAIVAVALLFDPNDYRDEIAAELSAATGRTVTINGELSMGFFPWLSIETQDVTVSAAPKFGQEPMVSIGKASAGVRLMPLLQGRIEAGMVTVEDMALRLAVAKNGTTSWQDLVDTLGGDTPGADDSNSDKTTTELDLSVAGIIVDNASIEYIDEQAGSRYLLSEFGLQVSGVDLGSPTPVIAGFKFLSAADEINGELAVNTSLRLSEPDKDGQQTITLSDLDAEGEVTTPTLGDAQAFSLRSDSLAYNLATSQMTLAEAGINFIGLDIKTALSGSTEPMALAGTIAVEQFSPRQLFDRLAMEAPETTDPAVLAKAVFSGDLSLSDTRASITGLTLTLDETQLRGEVTLNDFAKPAIRFDLSGTQMDLDRYLPPAEAGATEDAGDKVADSALPVDLIKGLDARGQFKMDRVTLGELPFENLSLGLNIGGDKAHLNPISATVLNGKYQGDVRIDASGRTPTLSLNETVSALDMGVLAKLLWERDNIEGTFAGSFKLAGRGTMLSEIRRSLNGNVSFSLTDGALAGTDLWYQIRRARAAFKQETAPAEPSPARTEFTEIKGTAVVKDGVATNNDFLAEIPFLRLTGAGKVDLGDSTVDYGLKARVLERPEFLSGATDAEINEYTEAVIPLKITGPLASPSIKPDIAGLAKAAAQKKIDAEEDRLRDRLKDKEDDLKKRLKDLF